MTDPWQRNLVSDEGEIARICKAIRRVAVLGIKPESESGKPAFYVPAYLQSAGLEVVPVPVYYPDATHILGQPVYRKVADIPGRVDLVDVFRRSEDLPPHAADLIAARPDVVWLQLGIRNDAFAEELARAGIRVVQDRCLMVDHRRAG